MSNDYIELGPDDVIREGDEIASEYNGKCMDNWSPCTRTIGTRVGDLAHVSFRRPRSTLIRDAAIEMLREVVSLGAELRDGEERLRKAIGISIEDLRKGGNPCDQ